MNEQAIQILINGDLCISIFVLIWRYRPYMYFGHNRLTWLFLTHYYFAGFQKWPTFHIFKRLVSISRPQHLLYTRFYILVIVVVVVPPIFVPAL
jgi:hypothetical protein